MYTFETTTRVRYAETDQMGFVYYGNYAIYYEIARVESLRALGLTYKKLEEDGIMMPVVENTSKYIYPAKYDDLIRIKLYIKDLPDKRITFQYELFNEVGKLLNLGETRLAFLDAKTGKTCRVPDVIFNLLKPYFE